ncbi:MAG: ATP-grasp domain-containing protein, partial [Candidatus Cloacimonadaceae bacterium]|nr:ATP-grasp domain-containing protein [Candidatus Cloacimonadaceae bacterium]
PYPSTGSDTFLARMDYILTKSKIDVIIPTLDSEIIIYIRLKDDLEIRGIKTYIPDEEQYLLRDKVKLSQFFGSKGIETPETFILQDVDQLQDFAMQDYPLIIKGRMYEAYKALNPREALAYFRILEEKWGLPIIVQKIVLGDEYNIVLVGDGEGGIIGMVPQRKLVITDKGKGFGGVVVRNPGMEVFATKVIKALNWRGPCELELIKSEDGKFYLLEINPRFPAWVRLAEGAGVNLPAATVLLAMGKSVAPFAAYKSGVMFIRHAEDVISEIATMGEVSVNGELIKKQEGEA